MQHIADKQGVIQGFRIGDSKDYKGYLAGDHKLRNPGNVNKLVDFLRQRKPIASMSRLLLPKTWRWRKKQMSAKASSISEYDKTKGEPEVERKNVLLDGHHPFVAYAELDLDLPDIETANEGLVNQAYHWDQVQNIK